MTGPDAGVTPPDSRTPTRRIRPDPSADSPGVIRAGSTTTLACPFCGTEVRPHRHRGVAAWLCPSCGAAMLPPDAASTLGLVPERPPETKHAYVEPQPQRDHGHVSGRRRPLLAPSWGLGARNPTADGRGLLR